jgi:phosphoenolpyruvate synthase/pyruvate phosphate dikinase
MTRYIRWFDDVSMGDIASVGGKNTSLGELRRALVPLDIKVPDEFVVTAEAYRLALEAGARGSASPGSSRGPTRPARTTCSHPAGCCRRVHGQHVRHQRHLVPGRYRAQGISRPHPKQK